jgi:hypothetical protein
MPEVFVATPIHNWRSVKEGGLADGISIRPRSPILWNEAASRALVSEFERENFDKTNWWLVAAADLPATNGSSVDQLYHNAHLAAMTLQILSPTGAQHVFLHCVQTEKGWDNLGSNHPKLLTTTSIVRTAKTESPDIESFAKIFAGLRQGFAERVVRLVNPLLLLEHGLQIGVAPLSHLFLAMALDVLFMAGETNAFVQRLGGFMGLDTFVFPHNEFFDLQPALTVREVVDDVYDLRNFLAHGREIPKSPYREPFPLKSTTNVEMNNQNLLYGDILQQATLFLLTGALRKIFTKDLYDQVKDQATWKQHMTLCEHRYKDAGGLAKEKRKQR